MSSTSPRRVPSSQSEAQGLQIDTFLNTLDWASDSHPRSTTQQPPKSCSACKSQRNESSSHDVPISIDHLTAHVRFRIGPHHHLVFSPIAPGEPPLCQVPVVLSIEDAKLRLSLTLSKNQDERRCIAINLSKLVAGPHLDHTEDTFCMEFVFPLISLLLEHPRRDAKDTNHEASRTRELQFAAMKEAVVELRDMPPSSDPQSTGRARNEASPDYPSFFSEALKKANQREETKNLSLDAAFTDLMNHGAEMVMPLCFPYNRRTTPSSAVGNTRADHAAFVNAYINQEAVWKRAIEQVDAALYFANRRSRNRKQGEGGDGQITGEADEIVRVEALNVFPKPP